MSTPVECTVSGCGMAFQGLGSISTSLVRMHLRVRDAPLDFDPGLLLVTGLDSLLALGCGLIAVPGDTHVARTRADLYVEGGIESGTLKVITVLERRRSRLGYRVQITETGLAMEVGEKAMAVSERTLLLASHTDGLAMLGVTAIQTSRGREWSAQISTRLQTELQGPVEACSVLLPPFSITHAAHDVRCTIALRRPLTAVPDDRKRPPRR